MGFSGMMGIIRGIIHIPHCCCYLVAMVIKRYVNNSFVLSPTEFILDKEVPEDDKHQLHILLLW